MNPLEKATYEYINTTKSVNAICKECGIGKATFYRNYKGKKRGHTNKNRKYNFSLESFQQDSKEKYYWLGFISADGAIVDNTLSIELKSIDRNHLLKFSNFCKNENLIADRVNNNQSECSRVSINSKELVEYLQTYNIVQNKSMIFEIPNNIPKEYQMDFIRGIIDGDGCIRINNHGQISLSFCSGNEKCTNQVKEILNITNKTSFSGGVYNFQVTGNKKARAILDKLYETSTEQCRLDRKYNVYKTLG